MLEMVNGVAMYAIGNGRQGLATAATGIGQLHLAIGSWDFLESRAEQSGVETRGLASTARLG